MSITQQQQENELTWEFENVIPIYRNGEIVKYSTSLSEIGRASCRERV